ncbi:MAG: phosphotransacetylase family protein [Coriobacteriia bacterium]|jgi:BioD-like phosphotransacetylase family protein|nr:phosphotransacetylase family protein [Coriobacteriia bacterium]
MNSFIVASTRPYIGKSGIVLALLAIAADRSHSTAYFKPYGTMPSTVDGVLTDLDAAYISRHTTSDAPLDVVCPVVESTTFLEDVIAGRRGDERGRVAAAFCAVSKEVDTVIIEGPSDTFQGRSVELSLPQVAEMLDTRVLLVTACERPVLPDAVLGAADHLGDRLAGVLFNNVRPMVEEFVMHDAIPFLESRGITVFGAVPHDMMLSSVTIREVVDELSATVLCAESHLDDRAESFLVGAMGQDKALRFFRRRARKLVVTGGDRSDVQLAALETDTAALVLTGDLPPSAHVLSRAEELGVPMVLVGFDTLSTVEHLDRMFGRVRLHDPAKAVRIREMLTGAVDIDKMFACLVGDTDAL